MTQDTKHVATIIFLVRKKSDILVEKETVRIIFSNFSVLCVAQYVKKFIFTLWSRIGDVGHFFLLHISLSSVYVKQYIVSERMWLLTREPDITWSHPGSPVLEGPGTPGCRAVGDGAALGTPPPHLHKGRWERGVMSTRLKPKCIHS